MCACVYIWEGEGLEEIGSEETGTGGSRCGLTGEMVQMDGGSWIHGPRGVS